MKASDAVSQAKYQTCHNGSSELQPTAPRDTQNNYSSNAECCRERRLPCRGENRDLGAFQTSVKTWALAMSRQRTLSNALSRARACSKLHVALLKMQQLMSVFALRRMGALRTPRNAYLENKPFEASCQGCGRARTHFSTSHRLYRMPCCAQQLVPGCSKQGVFPKSQSIHSSFHRSADTKQEMSDTCELRFLTYPPDPSCCCKMSPLVRNAIHVRAENSTLNRSRGSFRGAPREGRAKIRIVSSY